MFSGRADGDFSTPRDAARRGPADVGVRLFAGEPTEVTWLRQVHGSEVVLVSEPGAARAAAADAAVTRVCGAALVLRVADCLPVMLYGTDGSGVSGIAAAHAGWRGLLAGVVGRAAQRLREQLSGDVALWAVVGPHVASARYSFDGPERAELAERFGAAVASFTPDLTPAVDLGAACRAALAEADVDLDHMVATDAHDDQRRWFSHRAGDAARMAAAIVLRAAVTGGRP